MVIRNEFFRVFFFFVVVFIARFLLGDCREAFESLPPSSIVVVGSTTPVPSGFAAVSTIIVVISPSAQIRPIFSDTGWFLTINGKPGRSSLSSCFPFDPFAIKGTMKKRK